MRLFLVLLSFFSVLGIINIEMIIIIKELKDSSLKSFKKRIKEIKRETTRYFLKVCLKILISFVFSVVFKFTRTTVKEIRRLTIKKNKRVKIIFEVIKSGFKLFITKRFIPEIIKIVTTIV